MTRRPMTALFLALLAASCTASCGAETYPPSSGVSLTQRIGPEGGTFVVAGARVTFPAGALAVATSITITATEEPPPSGFTALSKVFRCEPGGIELAREVTIEMPFDEADDDGEPARMYWSTGSGATFEAIAAERRGSTMITTVKRWSGGFVGLPP